jgi:hypothetical protein
MGCSEPTGAVVAGAPPCIPRLGRALRAVGHHPGTERVTIRFLREPRLFVLHETHLARSLVRAAREGAGGLVPPPQPREAPRDALDDLVDADGVASDASSLDESV